MAGKEAAAGHDPSQSACHSPAPRGWGRGNYPEDAGKTPTEPQGPLFLFFFFSIFLFFFFLSSDVTVWWQESYRVSLPSFPKSPAPENLLLSCSEYPFALCENESETPRSQTRTVCAK